MSTIRSPSSPSWWGAVRLPALPLQALAVDADEAVLVASPKQKVLCCTRRCEEEGVLPGMPLSTAQVLVEARVCMRDMKAESALLSAVCEQLYALTPYLQPFSARPGDEMSAEGLVLEMSRSVRLFGGEGPLLERLLLLLRNTGLHFCYASAYSAEAAWLLSYAPESERRSQQDHTSWFAHCVERVLAMPLAAVDVFPQHIAALEGMGFQSMRDLWRHWQGDGHLALRKRFDTGFIEWLQAVLPPREEAQHDLFSGVQARPAPVYEPRQDYEDGLHFDYPIPTVELLQAPLKMLLQNLGDYLLARQLQCSGVTWVFSDIYHNEERRSVRCVPLHRDWHLLYELSVIQLEQSGLPFEVDYLELREPCVSALQSQGQSLPLTSTTHGNADLQKALQLTTARIQARVGENNVFKVSYRDDAIPERATARVAVHEEAAQGPAQGRDYLTRPDWLFNTPIAIGEHQNALQWHGRIQLVRGPERIEGHWWDTPTLRDYYIAVREDHVRLWVFHDLDRQRWYVHGVF